MPEAPLAPRRRWIDVILICAGGACLLLGWWLPGAALVAFGLVVPLLQRSGRRRGLSDHVPAELAAVHRDLVNAATLPGVRHTDVLEEAEESLLEVVALLGGKEPRRGAQRRLVAARCAAMAAAAAELRLWSDAWLAAKAEVDIVDSVSAVAQPPEREPGTGWLVGALAVGLSPVFLAWDIVCLVSRGVVLFADGLALRVRTAGRLLVRGFTGLIGLAARARQSWAHARAQLAYSVAEARHRFLATRARLHLRLRRARGQVRQAGRVS